MTLKNAESSEYAFGEFLFTVNQLYFLPAGDKIYFLDDASDSVIKETTKSVIYIGCKDSIPAAQ